MLEAAVRSAGIVDLLDAIPSVEDVKIFKPSPRGYHLASEHLEVRPAEVGFVFSKWDVAGAASAGLETFWIPRRAAEPPDELGFTADHTVRTITDLPALLGG
jgi:2-haloacid dehalogenase